MSLKRVRFPHVDLFTIADGFTDIDAIREGLEAEITANRERRVLREKEHAQQGRLKEVRNEWDGMHTRALPVPVLPNLQEFRKLSVVKIYEAGHPNAEQHTLRHPFVASVLAENLEQWREAARAGLAAVLGFPGWKNLSRRKLHPVDRLTARFRCKRCDAAVGDKKALDDGGMDFALACEHICTHLPKKRRNKEKWSAERFEPDRRVRNPPLRILYSVACRAQHVGLPRFWHAGYRCDLAGARAVRNDARRRGVDPDRGRARRSRAVPVVLVHHECPKCGMCAGLSSIRPFCSR